MSVVNVKRKSWSLRRDKQGYREYKITWQVQTNDLADGPLVAIGAGGLPAVGSFWNFGNDSDPWCFCTPEATVSMRLKNEQTYFWDVEQTFSNSPLTRCQDFSIDDPLQEPQKVSGSFVRFTKPLEKDRNGAAILSSSHEQVSGLERDASRPTVVIEQNSLVLDLPTFTSMVDTVNDAPLWGLSARCIKMGLPSWTRKLYGACTFYYSRKFEFEIKFDTWDLDDVVDKGFKVFDDSVTDNPANRADPTNYILYKDRNDENTPKAVLLDGNGSALTDPTSPVFLDPIEVYGESNFLLLGIPTSF